jgi:hypothetical protein
MTESFKLVLTEKRNKLYLGKYRYKANVYLEGVGYTYYSYNADDFFERIQNWKSQRMLILPGPYSNIKYDNIDFDLMQLYFDYKEEYKGRVSSRIEGNRVSFFSNDIEMFNPLYYIDGRLKLTEAIVRSPGTLYLKRQPKYKYRTYFKGKRSPKNFDEIVTNFKEQYPNVKVSEGLLREIFRRGGSWHTYVYIHGSHHVDYNDESMLSILHMIFGDMIGKTYNLAKEPKN